MALKQSVAFYMFNFRIQELSSHSYYETMLTDGLKIIIKKKYLAYNAALLSFTVLWRFYESGSGLYGNNLCVCGCARYTVNDIHQLYNDAVLFKGGVSLGDSE